MRAFDTSTENDIVFILSDAAVTINLAYVPLNLSNLTQIAIFGVGGDQGNSIYITDMNLSK
ncbi:hypothetical protein Patl_0094 [Paraglaciecola sp. T6c]|uniref:hypothetical protein n=1 Tax=Pseudoalteromonas atlantica (strain T6c / ATCC BAA-1087) TaxID=3042615 RepID=UPI0000DA6D64|nr:hypothetical protein [Paraglaciecola sp. T6c]ABG38626.1 hypothetical protein Patl_0094 [Paraglaciecola sp. T6c]